MSIEKRISKHLIGYCMPVDASQYIAQELIKEIITPLCKDAFEAGLEKCVEFKESHYSGSEEDPYPEYWTNGFREQKVNFHEWKAQNLK